MLDHHAHRHTHRRSNSYDAHFYDPSCCYHNRQRQQQVWHLINQQVVPPPTTTRQSSSLLSSKSSQLPLLPTSKPATAPAPATETMWFFTKRRSIMPPNTYNKNNTKDIINTNNKNNNNVNSKKKNHLCYMPNDVTLNIMSFLLPSDLEMGISKTCKVLREVSQNQSLWKELCQQTGKLQPPRKGVSSTPIVPPAKYLSSSHDEEEEDERDNTLSTCSNSSTSSDSDSFSEHGGHTTTTNNNNSSDKIDYIELYYSIPSVPYDFSSINEAIDHTRENGTITVLGPGTYNERLVLTQSVRIIGVVNPHRSVPTDSNNNNESNTKSTTTSTSHSATAPTIVWHNDHGSSSTNTSTQTNNINQSAIEILSNCGSTFVTIQNINIYHSSLGNNIWDGCNCAIYCHGEDSHTRLMGCSIQSDSGRGLVITDGASMEITNTCIHDCAATGVYCGTISSLIEIHNSNIISNGYGVTRDDDEHNDNQHHPQHPIVSSGHSGIYIEGAEAEIANTLLAGNCLTGLTLVKNGIVHMSDCDVTSNRSGPIMEIVDHTIQPPPQPAGAAPAAATTNPRRRRRRTAGGHNLEDEIVDVDNYDSDVEEEVEEEEDIVDDGGIYVAPTNNFDNHNHDGLDEQRQDDNESEEEEQMFLLGGTQRCPRVEHTRFTLSTTTAAASLV